MANLAAFISHKINNLMKKRVEISQDILYCFDILSLIFQAGPELKNMLELKKLLDRDL